MTLKEKVQRRQAIIAAIKAEPWITREEMAKRFGVGPDLIRALVHKHRLLHQPKPRPPIRKYHHGTDTPEYASWYSMIERCTNTKRAAWKYYGGANPPVLVCERWRDFRNFRADMGPRPKGTSLGRYEDSGNYEPGNCAWQTSKEQGIEKGKKLRKKPLPDVLTAMRAGLERWRKERRGTKAVSRG